MTFLFCVIKNVHREPTRLLSLHKCLDIVKPFFLKRIFSSQPFLSSPLFDGLASKLSLSIFLLKILFLLHFFFTNNYYLSQHFFEIILNIFYKYFSLSLSIFFFTAFSLFDGLAAKLSLSIKHLKK